MRLDFPSRLRWESSTGNPICVDSKMIKEKAELGSAVSMTGRICGAGIPEWKMCLFLGMQIVR